MDTEDTICRPSNAGTCLVVLPVFATIVLWLGLQTHQGANTNIGWMITAAMRLLSGDRMTDGYYDVNPPLSFLIYVPPAVLVRSFHLALYDANFLYTLVLTALSVAATWKLLVPVGIGQNTRVVFIASYLMACTLLPGHYFGDREHLLMLGLMPLSLAQLGITGGSRPRWRLSGPAIALGGLAVLLKPQYLIVPGLLVLHRAITWKNLRAFLSPDVLILAVVGCLVVVVIGVFFRDYLTGILPDMLTLYVSSLRNGSLLSMPLILGAIVAAMIVVTASSAPEPRWFIYILYTGSLLGLFSFVLQGKFFYYHLIPALMFFQWGTALLLRGAVADRQESQRQETTALMVALVFSIAFSAVCNRDGLSRFIYPSRYAHAADKSPTVYEWPSHDYYRRTPLIRLVKTYAAGGSYFIFGSMPMVQFPSLYTDAISGSRFPCYWFLPGLIEAEERLKRHQPSPMTKEELDRKKEKYAAMVVSDFKTYNPSLVILAHLYMSEAQDTPLDFAAWFSFNSDFARLWRHYKKVQTVNINSRDYYGGYDYGSADEVVTYDVYIKDGEASHR